MNIVGLIRNDMKKDKFQQLIKKNRFIDANLFNKLKNKKNCMICEYEPKETLEIHHIIPVRNGGASTEKNLIAICKNCHKKIHDTDIEKINFKLNEIYSYISSGNNNNKEVEESEIIKQKEHTISQLRAFNDELKIRIKQLSKTK